MLRRRRSLRLEARYIASSDCGAQFVEFVILPVIAHGGDFGLSVIERGAGLFRITGEMVEAGFPEKIVSAQQWWGVSRKIGRRPQLPLQ
jgi:hypothetical protein